MVSPPVELGSKCTVTFRWLATACPAWRAGRGDLDVDHHVGGPLLWFGYIGVDRRRLVGDAWRLLGGGRRWRGRGWLSGRRRSIRLRCRGRVRRARVNRL